MEVAGAGDGDLSNSNAAGLAYTGPPPRSSYWVTLGESCAVNPDDLPGLAISLGHHLGLPARRGQPETRRHGCDAFSRNGEDRCFLVFVGTAFFSATIGGNVLKWYGINAHHDIANCSPKNWRKIPVSTPTVSEFGISSFFATTLTRSKVIGHWVAGGPVRSETLNYFNNQTWLAYMTGVTEEQPGGQGWDLIFLILGLCVITADGAGLGGSSDVHLASGEWPGELRSNGNSTLRMEEYRWFSISWGAPLPV